MKHEPNLSIHMEKSLLTVWLCQYAGWIGVSGNLQCRGNSVSQVDGVCDMTPACRLCGSVGGVFKKGGNGLCLLSAWEKVVLQLSP